MFQSDADIIPDPENGVLRVRILGTASNARDADIAGLLDELNRMRTVFPGTGLRMIYELPDNARKPGPEASLCLGKSDSRSGHLKFVSRSAIIQNINHSVGKSWASPRLP